jgi:hypothetical protein
MVSSDSNVPGNDQRWGARDELGTVFIIKTKTQPSRFADALKIARVFTNVYLFSILFYHFLSSLPREIFAQAIGNSMRNEFFIWKRTFT